MEAIDKMMADLGFNELSVKNYTLAIPFTSRKSDIMDQINQLNLKTEKASDIYPLFYILSIAFFVLLMRVIVFVKTGDVRIFKYLTSIVIRYSQVLQDSLMALSFLISVLICFGIGFVVFRLKNEKYFC